MNKHIHFIGIAGSGASACASITHSLGYKVTGCDINPTDEFTKHLKGIEIQKGHSTDHLNGVDILTITPAITSLDPQNPELLEAKIRKIKVLTWQEFLGRKLAQRKFVIAVCGTHGKTTTTAMIGILLEGAGFDPTVILGANVPKWGANFRVGLSKYLVIEADEFNDNYLSLIPDISVLTNIEFDHPEYFKDFLSYKRSFQNFLHKTKELIIANLEDHGTKETLMEEGASYGMFFKPIVDYSKTLIDFPLNSAGEFNRLNASAAYQVGIALNINPKRIQESLANFEGVRRRMEYLGKFNGARVYSDFGHHPTEIKATIEAFKEKFPDKKIILVYQPHMFSRTKALFGDFVKVFTKLPISQGYIMDIYPSREEDTGLIHSEELVEAIDEKKEPLEHSRFFYAPYKEELIQNLTDINYGVNKDDVVIFMGAGDIDQMARELIR